MAVGSRGPVPKRKDQLRGHRAKDELAAVTRAPGMSRVPVPSESREWHPVAKRLWRAAKDSGQAQFYQPSDWAVFYFLMEELSEYVRAPRRNGQILTAILSGLSTLLVTEGDRRRLQVELTQPSSEELASAGVEEMAKWREKMGG